MIISKTPLRMSFAGGGSDLPAFYERAEGAVVTAAINKHIYVTVNKKFDDNIRLSYSETENVSHVDHIKHRIVKVVLKKLNIAGGIEITSIADIPSKGTGLGSSSAFAVGLLNALHAHHHRFVSAEDLAKEASEVELDILRDPVGKQDHYGTAFGGLKLIRFFSDGAVSVSPIICSQQTRQALENNILVLYTGLARSAAPILENQKANLETDEKKFLLIKKMAQLAHDLSTELQKNNTDSFGEILHANWMYKRELAPDITTPEIDSWYDIGRKNGALGGKILGAGGGGFLMFYAPQEKHEAIKRAMPALRPFNFQFENQGSQIIFIH